MPPPYRPFDFMVDSREFGRNPLAAWETPPVDEVQLARYLASAYQHAVALAVNEWVGDTTKGERMATLGQPMGESTDYIRKKLHGHVPAQMDDYMAWALIVGVDILPAELMNLYDLVGLTVNEAGPVGQMTPRLTSL